MTELKPNVQRFADEYLIDFNAGRAYERAGYKAKGKSADAAAARLLATPGVQAYLSARRSELAQKFEVTLDEVIKRVAHMALGDIRPLFDQDGNLKPIHEMTAEEAAMLQGVEVFEKFEGVGEARAFTGYTKKIKFVSRLDAAVRLGQHLGGFGRKTEVTGPGGGPVQMTGVGEVLSMIDGSDTGIGPASSRQQ